MAVLAMSEQPEGHRLSSMKMHTSKQRIQIAEMAAVRAPNRYTSRLRDRRFIARAQAAIMMVVFSITMSGVAIAGGSYAEVIVAGFAPGESADEGRLELEEASNLYPLVISKSCAKMMIHIRYDHDRWRNYHKPMSVAQHREILVLLRGYAQRKQRIEFGTIGRGLIEIPDRPCEFSSRGLFQDSSAIFSVNDRI